MRPHLDLDLDRFPLHRPDSAGYQNLVDAKQEDWTRNGAFSLPGFMAKGDTDKAAKELLSAFDTVSYRHRKAHNVYFSSPSKSLPTDLAEPTLFTSHSSLTGDQLVGTAIRAVYDWDPLCDFLRRVMQLPALYRMADPMACLNVMSYGPGDGLDWHFDRAGFAVTILLQAAEEGGAFEYRRNLRSDDDPNYDGVRRVLSGSDDTIRRSQAEPGTLTVFAGRQSVHRVAPVLGGTRVMAVLSFMEQADYQYSTEDRIRFYGRGQPSDAPVRGI